MRPKTRVGWGWIAWFLMALVAAAPGGSQTLPGTTPTTETQTPEPSAVALADIPTEADALITRLRAFEQSVDEDVAGDLEAELRELESSVEDLGTEFEATDLDQLPLSTFEILRQTWTRTATRLGDVEGKLTERWTELQSYREELARAAERWQGTRRILSEDQEAARSLTDRLEQLLEEISVSGASLDLALDRLIELIDRTKAVLERTDAVLKQLDASSTAALAQLLEADSPPIWTRDARSDATLLPALTAGASDTIQRFLTYAASRKVRFSLQFLLFVILIGALLDLRRRAVRWELPPDALAAPRFLMSRPVSTAWFLALLTSPLAHEGSRTYVADVLLLLALPAVVRLTAGFVTDRSRWPVALFLLLFGLETTRQIVLVGEHRSRLATLLLVISLCLLIAWMIRQSRGEELGRGTWPWVVRLIMGLYTVALVGAIGAIVLGWTRLGELVSEAAYMTTYTGIVATLAVVTIEGFVTAVPDTPLGRRLRITTTHRDLSVRWVTFLLRLFVFWIWFWGALRRFQIRDPVTSRVDSILEHELHLGTLEFSVGRLVTAVGVVLVGYAVSRFVRFVMNEEILPQFSVRRGVAHAVSTIVYYAILAAAIIAAASALGLDASSLALMASAVGIGIGFGLQAIVNNFVSGLILIFERPVKVGDMVQVGGTFGTVNNIGIRASTIRTFDGADVVVPNGTLISAEVTNWTLSDQKRRRDVDVLIEPGTDERRVVELLTAAATADERVLTEPAPSVFFFGYQDGAMRFSLRFWVPIEGSLGTWSDVGLAATRALTDAGIRIARPQRDLRLHQEPAAETHHPETDQESRT